MTITINPGTGPVEGATLEHAKANMDAFAGLPAVQVALHYKGTVANNWWVDEVRVLTTNPVYKIRHLVAGSTARFEVRGVPPGPPRATQCSSRLGDRAFPVEARRTPHAGTQRRALQLRPR